MSRQLRFLALLSHFIAISPTLQPTLLPSFRPSLRLVLYPMPTLDLNSAPFSHLGFWHRASRGINRTMKVLGATTLPQRASLIGALLILLILICAIIVARFRPRLRATTVLVEARIKRKSKDQSGVKSDRDGLNPRLVGSQVVLRGGVFSDHSSLKGFPGMSGKVIAMDRPTCT